MPRAGDSKQNETGMRQGHVPLEHRDQWVSGIDKVERLGDETGGLEKIMLFVILSLILRTIGEFGAGK